MNFITTLQSWTKRPLHGVVLIAGISFLGVALLVGLTGVPDPGTFSSGVEDEMSHLLLAQTFAEGRLTNPPHPLWQHFETQYVIPQPTYTSKYPPALPLLMAVGIVLGGHAFYGIWLGLVLMCAAVAWMFYIWLPNRWAFCGALLFTLHLGIFSDWTYYFSGGGIPTVIGAALLLGAMRQIMRQPTISIALVLGAGLLVLSFGRPYEGFVLSLMIALVLGWWLCFDRRQSLSLKLKVAVAPILATLLLTVALHMIYNTAVTGKPFELPYQRYVAQYREVPNIMLSRPGEPPDTPHVVMRAKWEAEYQVYLTQRSIPGLARATWWKLKEYWWFYIGPVLSIPLLLLPCCVRQRWNFFALLAVLGVLGAVCLNFAMQVHYPAPAAPLIFLLIVQGLRYLRILGRNSPLARRIFWPSVAAFVVATAGVATLRALDYAQERKKVPSWVRQRLEVRDFLLGKPGEDLVIVTFDKNIKPHMDVIFNEPRIDEAAIVWARSITPEDDARLMDYFKSRRIWTLHLSGAPEEVAMPRPLQAP